MSEQGEKLILLGFAFSSLDQIGKFRNIFFCLQSQFLVIKYLQFPTREVVPLRRKEKEIFQIR